MTSNWDSKFVMKSSRSRSLEWKRKNCSLHCKQWINFRQTSTLWLFICDVEEPFRTSVGMLCLLSVDPNICILHVFQGEHQNSGGIWKRGFWHTKALISLKPGKIGPRLLLRSHRKSSTRFRLVSNSMTLEGHCALCVKTCALMLFIYF